MSQALSDRERFPELFIEGTIDRRNYRHVVPTKVLVCGMFRTGTKFECFICPDAWRLSIKVGSP